MEDGVPSPNRRRNRIAETFATAWGAAKLVLIFGSPFLILGVISLGRIFSSGPFVQFALGDAYIPKFMDASATNLTVFSSCVHVGNGMPWKSGRGA